jgi:hypothetical protein
VAGEYISRVGLIAIDQVIMLYCFFLKYLPSPPPPPEVFNQGRGSPVWTRKEEDHQDTCGR